MGIKFKKEYPFICFNLLWKTRKNKTMKCNKTILEKYVKFPCLLSHAKIE